MSTTLEPTGDRLIVEPIEEDSVTKSGIILPDQAREKPCRGIITAIGPNVGRETGHDGPQFQRADGSRVPLAPGPMEPLAIGDEVLYSKYGGTELKVDLHPVVLLRETDVFCRVHEEAEELAAEDREEEEVAA